jgi:dinuclear metal center YbgI/SA1388 family protein
VTTEAILRAKSLDAQMLIVHHGLFWNTEPRTVDERQALRLDALAEADMSLLGYHLALDAHPEIGNNILACKMMGVENPEPFGEIGWGGIVPIGTPVSKRIMDAYPGAMITRFDYGKQPPLKVCAITGGGGNYIHQAVKEGYDLFLTGEAEEPSKALARELGISFVAAGHHATEKAGVQALGDRIAREFEIEHVFIDVHNPV